MRLLPSGGKIVAGSVVLSGRDLTRLSEAEMRSVRGAEVAMVFQDPMTSLNPTMTVGDQVAETLRIHRRAGRKQANARALEMLDLVGIPSPRDRMRAYPHHLSGGLRQRVVIATALACSPKLLIADEPTTALDVTIQSQILSLLDELKTELGMGLILISHDMGVIANCADRVAVMYAGQVIESAPQARLFKQMHHPYTQALLESIPDLHADHAGELYSIQGQPPSLVSPPKHCRFAARCGYVQDRCWAEAPVLSGEDEHAFACFYPVDGPMTERTASGGDGAQASEAAAAPAGPLLAIDHVSKEFPVRQGVLSRRTGSVKAVSDVSFSVMPGETFGLVGESGCGKSTLARVILGLEAPDSGTISFNGQDVSRLRGKALRQLRAGVQMVFQDPYASLDPRLRVARIVREPLAAQRLGTRKTQNARVRDLLSRVGLPEAAMDQYPHQFSGGQRQRIAIARSLAVSPKLVVADEPTSALDVSIQSQVLNLMRTLQRERQDLTYIVISHDLAAVRYLADRVGVMYLGKLVELGAARDVYESPAHPYTAGLLGAVPEVNLDPAARHSKPPVRGELPSAVDPPSGCRFRTRCPRAQEVCGEEEPPLLDVATPGHGVACHFPLGAPPRTVQAAETASGD